MPLDSLLSLVEKLRERIDAHGPALRQSEALTRYALIDPLLRELGWDTEDPDSVIPEYKTDDGWPDYALLSDGKPIMMVEAKKLGTALQGKVIRQGIGYCQEQGTLYFSVTDGRLWKIYETHRPVPIDEKRIAEFDLKDGPATEVCLKTLALWRPNVDSGQLAQGQAPVVVPTPNRSAQPESPIQKTQQTPPPDELKPGWQTIAGLNPQRGSPPPAEVRFPDNSLSSLKTWKSLMVEVTRWLILRDYLKATNCPIQKPRSKRRYIVSDRPFHPSGDPFRNGAQVESLHVETHASSEDIAKTARLIIEYVGQDPAQFKVRFS